MAIISFPLSINTTTQPPVPHHHPHHCHHNRTTTAPPQSHYRHLQTPTTNISPPPLVPPHFKNTIQNLTNASRTQDHLICCHPFYTVKHLPFGYNVPVLLKFFSKT
ncbi:hypothetical protein HanRHA438_Chr15g0717761 [Helianthus annuus]|nr:hypothetical protein HanRHA438_Chr15g0717761 [Helianthus annuus]